MNAKNEKSKPSNSIFMLIIIMIAAFPLWVPAIIISVDKFYYTPLRTTEIMWDIKIPSTFTQSYHASSDNYYSRADSYTVYNTQESDLSFLKNFTKNKNDSIENFVKEISKNLSIKKEYNPILEQDYLYFQKFKKGSDGYDRLVILYFPDSDLCFYVRACNYVNSNI